MNEIISRTTTFSETSGEVSAAEHQKSKHVKKYKQNWRINLLSTPKVPREKFHPPPDTIETGVKPEALQQYNLPERIDHMARPQIRTLVVNKKVFTPIYHEPYEKKMDQKIEASWNSMYNVYKKAKRDIARKSSDASRRSRSCRGGRMRGRRDKKDRIAKADKKGGKDKGKKKDKKGGGAPTGKKEKTEEEIEKEIQQWINSRSKPKPEFKPEPIPRGPLADLMELKDKIDVLATPKKVSTIEPKDPKMIAQAALTYEPTEKIVELAKPSPWKLIKDEPLIPGHVKPEALTYKPTPRISELAKPKITQNVHESDLKDDAFVISPNALKYVATPRILELAKPLERE